MKKFGTLVIALLMVMSGLLTVIPAAAAEDPVPTDIQPMGTQRVVLAELITGAWCGPCVNANKGLQMVEDNYERDEIVILAYHSSDDLSNLESNARIALYNPSGVPHARFDGTGIAHGSAGTPAQNYNRYVGLYNARTSVSSPLRITVEWDYNDITGEGDVWVNITAVDTPTQTNLKLHTAVFEMNYGPYNGGNGEEWHNWTAHDFLESEGAAGTTVSLTQGQDKRVTYSFDTSSYAQDKEQVGIIAFVQSHSTLEVLQAAYVNVPVLPNVPPVIQNGHAIVPDGATEDDEVTFKVFYYDTDDRRDDGPRVAKVYFKNETSPVMEHSLEAIPSADPWTVGKWMKYTTKLAPGTYTYKFSASDGEDDALGDTDWNSTTFVIKPRNKIPELMSASYVPLRGDTKTVFTFDVMYRDKDNEAPASAKVFIDGTGFDMQTDEAGPFNDWVTYYYKTTLAVGDTHKFYYVFSDGIDDIRFPAESESPNWIRGPEVEPPNNEPTLTTPIVTPGTGSRLTEFTFSIIYTDGEGDHPMMSYIYIDDVAYIMDPQDTNYESGARFVYKTTLKLGTPMIYYTFSDGKHTVRFPPAGYWEGPEVTNLEPQAKIASPMDGVRYTPTDYVPFSAVGSDDPEKDELEYEWTSSLQGPLGTSIAFDKMLVEGTHTITLTVRDPYGAEHSTSVEVLIKPYMPQPFIDDMRLNNEIPIEKDTVRVTVSLGNDGEARQNNLDVTFLVDDVEVSSDKASVDIGAAVDIIFTWEAQEGEHVLRVEIAGDAEEITLYVNPNTKPTAVPTIINAGSLAAKYDTGEELYFKAGAEDANGDSLTYLWDFGDGFTSTQAEPSHIYNTPGKYKVNLNVTDSRGGVYQLDPPIQVTIKEEIEEETGGAGAMLIAILVAVVLVIVVVLFLFMRKPRPGLHEEERPSEPAAPAEKAPEAPRSGYEDQLPTYDDKNLYDQY